MRIDSDVRVLITGAPRGIGAALAWALAQRGASVGLAARSADELERLRASLPGHRHVAGPRSASS